MQTIQTTFTFNTKQAAQIFERWLKKNINDRDYGFPLCLDVREVRGGFCVEYSCKGDMARGVATGISISCDF